VQQAPTSNSVLYVLSKPRLIALGRDVDIVVPPSATKEEQVKTLVVSGRLPFHDLLRRLGRDELKAACRAHGLEDAGRARPELAARILKARKGPESAPPSALFLAREIARHTPRRGDVVLCRHRQWLVEEVVQAPEAGQSTRVRMVCLDDDNQGRVLEALWELELGAKVHRPEAHGLGEIDHVDPPRHFGAYLHALKWNAVTATDGRLFQAPFRAGIRLQAHQLTPLKKALELPRANLFIADDVGLGKTIEAGLVLSELSLRQRVDLSLIICPASVCLQWRDEMAKRFGMRFEIMSRAFVAARRKERGFGVNPWATHQRFIVSHQLMRRPEYRDPLLAHLGDRARKSLLILDEAHIAAPSSASKYAVDSAITKVMRDIAPRFENRLFLSATPHNGHSNSFSALLEILDPQRFTRGVRISGRAQLEPVMVRRLKSDLRDAGVMKFPERKVIQLRLTNVEGQWQLIERTWDKQQQRYDDFKARALGPADPFELELASDLARYTELARPEKGRGKLVFINLQKRLLSSVEAFSRTLQVHSRSLGAKAGTEGGRVLSLGDDDEAFGQHDDALEAIAEAEVAQQTRLVEPPSDTARKLLSKMLASAERCRNRPDAKVLALIDWMRRHQCAAVRIGGASSSWPPAKKAKKASVPENTGWSERRLLIFTEYGDTKRYLVQMLTAAIAGTDDADARILQLHGGMSDEQREEVQRAFNGPPVRHPVRILIATDAAREGINLQAHCADLVHFDVPWNPARMEQRNGRIDRILQPKDSVQCSYFAYAQRSEDPVLATLVEKSEVIAKELGSLGTVVMEDIATDLEQRGLDSSTITRIAKLASAKEVGASRDELETTRKHLDSLKADVEEAGEILNRSAKVLEFDSALLRDAIDVGFELAGAAKLERDEAHREQVAYKLPSLPESWAGTLDALRPTRGRDEAFWEWRRRAPLPVTFEPLEGWGSEAVHLHLSHPLVQRVMSRFLAQGYSMSDLSRITVVKNKHDALVRVIAFGRLSLFGAGATRLHDQLISVAARWVEGKKDPLRPFAEDGDRKAVEMLERILAESPTLQGIPRAALDRVQAAAPDLFAQLWKPIREEADARAVEAIAMLKARGRSESDGLRLIVSQQRSAIQRRLGEQLKLDFAESEREQRLQFERDRKHMEKRLIELEREIESEPQQVESLYNVELHRLQPVGLVVLWPATRS
jgi:SNF2 family DNA or RNA helicase